MTASLEPLQALVLGRSQMSELTKNLAQNLVAIISDFGLIDNYAGVMKGVMLDIASPLEIVDITHQVPPQNVLVARFALATAVAYFPAGTVFLSVVDPGVGTGRRAIAARTKSHYFVGPDNGIFSAVFERDPAIAAVELNNSNYWRDAQPSSTFHGRDIFAPAAAHLANGVALKQLGEAIA
ncbi:MAG: SAM-dependent chlorinase/fluorinase, partial [Cyanobacteria bacterium P01_D01_bin.73]